MQLSSKGPPNENAKQYVSHVNYNSSKLSSPTGKYYAVHYLNCIHHTALIQQKRRPKPIIWHCMRLVEKKISEISRCEKKRHWSMKCHKKLQRAVKAQARLAPDNKSRPRIEAKLRMSVKNVSPGISTRTFLKYLRQNIAQDHNLNEF